MQANRNPLYISLVCIVSHFNIFATAGGPSPLRNIIRGNFKHSSHRASSEISRIASLKKFDLVKYDNHPMQAWADDAHRKLLQAHEGSADDLKQEPEIPSNETHLEASMAHAGLWSPLRITFYTEALNEVNGVEDAPKIRFMKYELLPKVAEFWSQALSVIPVKGNLFLDESDLSDGGYCGGPAFSVVPDAHTQQGQGVPDTDLVLYISAETTYCSSATVAFSNYCSYDVFDRPVAGAVNVCLDKINSSLDESTREWLFSIMIHEIAHVLFMSAGHFPYFRYADGTPRTARPINLTEIECPSGERKITSIPDKNTLDFFTDSNGRRHATIVTERVRVVTQNQFNCASLPGARLENFPSSGSCVGAHWDERESFSSTMSAIVDGSTFLTPLSLALAEDSSSYKSNYTSTRVSPWGHGAGCSFIDKPCLVADENGNMVVPDYGRGFFCAKKREMGCNTAHTHKLMCSKTPAQMGENPSCLAYIAPFTSRLFATSFDGDCTKKSNKRFSSNSEYFGEDSMCFETTSKRRKAQCQRARCVVDERVVKVYLENKWYTCKEDFQEIRGGVICPRLASACPQMFCPANCAGRGRCDYENVENGVVVPKCICNDPADTSPGCSTSFVFDEKYVGKADNLADSHTEGRTAGPFVSIFARRPRDWVGATFGWFSGMVLLLLGAVTLCAAGSCARVKKVQPSVVRGNP